MRLPPYAVRAVRLRLAFAGPVEGTSVLSRLASFAGLRWWTSVLSRLAAWLSLGSVWGRSCLAPGWGHSLKADKEDWKEYLCICEN